MVGVHFFFVFFPICAIQWGEKIELFSGLYLPEPLPAVWCDWCKCMVLVLFFFYFLLCCCCVRFGSCANLFIWDADCNGALGTMHCHILSYIVCMVVWKSYALFNTCTRQTHTDTNTLAHTYTPTQKPHILISNCNLNLRMNRTNGCIFL